MDRGITNFLYKQAGRSVYCYTFQIGFGHSVLTDKNEQVFDEVTAGCPNVFPKKPEYVLIRSGAFERVYIVYVYVGKPEDIFVYRPLTSQQV